MKNTFFKTIGYKVGYGKMILLSVVDENFMDCGDIPSIFEVQSIKQAPTIYTGTYPTIKINLETLKERKDLKGMGAAGILTEEQWYCAEREEKDYLGISI